jgi:ABC-type multidrug transport system fused ATPase/permease subunit
MVIEFTMWFLSNNRLRENIVHKCIQVLSKRDKKILAAVIVLQIFLSILDLVGVALAGILGALAITGIGSREPGNRVGAVLRILNLDNYSLEIQAGVIGSLAALVFIIRTLASIWITRRTLYFMARRAAAISSELVSRILSSPLTFIQSRSIQDLQYNITNGIEAVTLGILATAVSIVSDIALLSVLSIGLFILNPIISISTFVLFGLTGFGLYKLSQKKALKLGISNKTTRVEGNVKIYEVLISFREAVVRNRRNYYFKEIERLRSELAENLAETAFMPNIGKYVIEATVIFGTLLLGASQFVLQDSARAVATISVFMAAASRIAPAILRLQQNFLQIKNSFGSAKPALDLLEELKDSPVLSDTSDSFDRQYLDFRPKIEIQNVYYAYPNNKSMTLHDISLVINEGEVVAFVGPSGAGKTTLIDVILGILSPLSGKVTISEESPSFAISKWQGAISYVPQDVYIADGSIVKNVTLGYPNVLSDEKFVAEALSKADLQKFVEGLPQKLFTPVGERGSKLSGGQRQRLGIARALFTNPKLLVLDEATSALDGESEASISQAINQLRGETTVILIAHRLSTIRKADKIIYMDSGRIISSGSFDEVRADVPNFDKQANLMGL